MASQRPSGQARPPRAPHVGAATLLALGLLPLLMGVDLFQRHNRAVEDGNARMKAGKAEEALSEYDKAVAKLPHDPGAHFARGTALYSLSRWEDAAGEFLHATEAKTPDLKASAFYNLGNAFFQSQKYGESAEAFKKSLAYNPGNLRAKWNLELALRKKKADDQKKKDDQKKNPNAKDDKKKDDKQKQDKGDKQDKNDDKNKDQQAKDDQKKDDKKKDDSDKGKDGQDGKNDDNGQAQQPPQPQQDKGEDEKKKEAEAAKKDAEKPPQPQPQPGDKNQNPQQAKGEGQKGEPSGEPRKDQPPADPREIEGILDNLERSPKTLEQELARVRAVNRRPPVKDW